MSLFILIFFTLLVAYTYLINRYHSGWDSLPEYNSVNASASTPLSVVIAVRNEAHNIKQLLDSLSEQSFPATLFEVIIVNDESTDATLKLLREQPVSFNLTILNVSSDASPNGAGNGSKKRALDLGIEKAKHDVIVTTDADCTFNREWLETLSHLYTHNDNHAIAGPVILKTRNSFLGLFQVLDFLTLQGITAGALTQRMHVLANGANFSYRKKMYKQVGGFNGIEAVPSGDDVLLMQKFFDVDSAKVAYLKSRQAIVITEGAGNWGEFLNQRIRWSGKTGFYKDKKLKWVLIFVWVFNLCFLVLAVITFVKSFYLFLLILFLLAKIVIEFPFVNAVASFFGKQKLMWLFPLFQPIHILYTIIAGFFGKFGTYTWKGRKFRVQ